MRAILDIVIPTLVMLALLGLLAWAAATNNNNKLQDTHELQ